MTPTIPVVAVFYHGDERPSIETTFKESWFTNQIKAIYCNYNTALDELYRQKVSVVIVVGPAIQFKNLLYCYLPTLHIPNIDKLNGDVIYQFYINSIVKDINPVVSIFTPAYKSYDRIVRAYKSLIRQSWSNWEWIILDDSPDSHYDFLLENFGHDYRIKIYKQNRQDGFVGSTKRQAASLCHGEYLLELDHDDELHHLALEYVVSAFKRYPDAGFVYTNSCEVFETGGNVYYNPGYAMGFGRHFQVKYQGRELIGSDTPINEMTMSHIVGVPNHIRCWKRNTYFNVARHNNKMYIVDDYELMIRTYLNTKIVHVQEMLYIQYMNAGGNNTQESRRPEIQRLVSQMAKHYRKQIQERTEQLKLEFYDPLKLSYVY